ncbi:MAG: hypothetical protein OEX04_16440, partial [Acidimicrobiia bacterium]|nr:hypothetical protein [Acidimicrobiia bacterium]
MERSTVRILGPSRIVALTVIVLLLAGLAYLGFAAGEQPVIVPDGAQAGDLTLEPCTYEAENGPLAADCGTLVVPENREKPGSRLIAVPVVRVRALTENPAEPVFFLQGG